MSKNAILACFFLNLAIVPFSFAEIKSYQSTDNTGLNKREQIDGIEKYLQDLSSTLKKMETQIDSNSLKLKSLDEALRALKDGELKKIKDQLAETKSGNATVATAPNAPEAAENKAELDKLKADILSIKNSDIDQLQTDVRTLNSSVQYIQDLLKIRQK